MPNTEPGINPDNYIDAVQPFQEANIGLYNDFNNRVEAIKTAINNTILAGAHEKYQTMFNIATLLAEGTIEGEINETFATQPNIRNAVLAYLNAMNNLTDDQRALYEQGILGLLFRLAWISN